MLTVMAARLVGNVFTEGLYDIHIHCRHLYFLEEDEGLSSHVELHDLTVSEIMTKRPICLRPVVKVPYPCYTLAPCPVLKYINPLSLIDCE